MRGAAAIVMLVLIPRAMQAQAPAAANLSAARSAMAKGLDAMQKGNFAEAKHDFSIVTQLAPNVEPGHAALGSALLALQEFASAAHELEVAHQLEPEDVSATLNLGRANVALGRYDEAITNFNAALVGPNPPSLSPDEVIAYASALAATTQRPAAISILEKALTTTPDSAPLEDALGTLMAQQGDLEKALPHFARAIAIDPQLATANRHTAAALSALGRPDEAIPYGEKAVAAMPNDFNAQLELGRALSALHRDTYALLHLHRAAELLSATNRQTPDALYSLAVALQASGDARASLPVFAEALRDTSSPQTATFSRGSALINYALARVLTGDAAGALPIYAQALAVGPDTATLREDFGAAYLQQTDLDHAIEQFKAGLALEPSNPHLHYDLGLAYKLKDNLEAAVPEFEQSAALDPSLPDPAFTLGVIYMQQGRYPEAIASLRRATTLQPANGDAWALLGGVLKDSGDAPGATAALQHAIELQPDQPSLHIQLATLETQTGHPAEAAAERKTAANLSRAAMNHQRAEFALKSGRTLLEQNKLDDAAFQLTTAAHAEPSLAEPHRLLAEVYTRQGKTADAAVESQQANALASANKP